MKLKIKDIEWTFAVLPDKEYTAEHGKDSNGITMKYKQVVHFKESALTLGLVAHELFHAYSASCCISSTNDLSQDDMEEVGAEIAEFHLDDMIRYRDKIYERLSR